MHGVTMKFKKVPMFLKSAAISLRYCYEYFMVLLFLGLVKSDVIVSVSEG